jgi:leader peptidase (prepilin peptidase)/N-methyltransferase
MALDDVIGVALAAVLAWASIIDARRLILPDALTLPLILLGVLLACLEPPSLTDRLVGAACGFLVFFGIARLYRTWRGRDGLGLGDAKLLAAAGAWVGWPGLSSVVLIAAMGGLAWAVLTRPPADRPIPFGPFLAAGFWLVWRFGPLTFG